MYLYRFGIASIVLRYCFDIASVLLRSFLFNFKRVKDHVNRQATDDKLL